MFFPLARQPSKVFELYDGPGPGELLLLLVRHDSPSSEWYNVFPSMTNWAANYSSPVLRPKLNYLYENRDPNTLWWRVAAQRLKLKKVVRNHHARRLRKIFTEVLYLKGYDENGQPLPQEKLPEGVSLCDNPLLGTLDIEPLKSIVTQDDMQVRNSMSGLLDGVLRLKEKWPIDPETNTWKRLSK